MFENIDWVMLLGQALGVVAVILGFVTYQMKSPKALLIVNLITCGVSVETAAEQSGFNDSKYFARVVKKYYHCTPRELKHHGK